MHQHRGGQVLEGVAHRLEHRPLGRALPARHLVAAQLRQRCAQFAEPIASRAVWQLVNTLVPFAALWGLMAWSVIDHWNYLWTLLFALPTAGLYVRTFIIQHDCGHRAFFRSPWLNDWVGRAIGVVTLTPHDCWRRTHGIHHATSGNLDRRELGAVRTVSVEEYRAGKEKAFNALVGQVMKGSRGKANPAQVNALLMKKLG